MLLTRLKPPSHLKYTIQKLQKIDKMLCSKLITASPETYSIHPSNSIVSYHGQWWLSRWIKHWWANKTRRRKLSSIVILLHPVLYPDEHLHSRFWSLDLLASFSKPSQLTCQSMRQFMQMSCQQGMIFTKRANFYSAKESHHMHVHGSILGLDALWASMLSI